MSEKDTRPDLDDTVLARPRAGASIDEAELTRGALIDHYEVSARLGAGGMGVVYLAHDPRLGRDVAVKLLRTEAAVGSEACRELCARLVREARAMARVSHPNLVAVHDIGTFRERVYIVMEYVDGCTLREWVAMRDRPWAERLDAVLSAGRGLAEAHAAGVIHRDFKPDNILVARNGRVLVADFGLARGAQEHAADLGSGGTEHCHADVGPSLTAHGAVLGTPAYMAPEQYRGEVADARSDQFAYAVTAWEVLYDRPPFPGRTIRDLIEAAESGDIVDPGRSEIPAAITQVLRRALSARPAERYPSLEELLAALGQAARSHWRLLERLRGMLRPRDKR